MSVRRATGNRTNPCAKCLKIMVDLKMKFNLMLHFNFVLFVVIDKYIRDLKMHML